MSLITVFQRVFITALWRVLYRFPACFVLPLSVVFFTILQQVAIQDHNYLTIALALFHR